LLDRLVTSARTMAPQLTEWRHHLHAYPEVSFQEVETTAWLAGFMERWGIPYTRPAATGLVGVIEGSRPGPTIALRADIDALPMQELNTFEFASKRPGAMHACGHDGHTAVLLGLAKFFSENRDFPGKIVLLFQHAEEKAPGGAKSFVEAGALEGVSACLGLHFSSQDVTGTAHIAAGPITANSDSWTAVIKGKGGHGAAPHRTIDAVMVACNAVVNLQTVVARKVDPIQPAVLTVGSIHGGTTFNIIADEAELKGTVRTYDRAVRQQVHDELIRTLESTCAMYGATVEVSYIWGYPALVNHEGMTELLKTTAVEVFGADKVKKQVPLMGGEDFAYYAEKVPSAFLFVGARNAEVGAEFEHHHPRFTIDDAALPYGMELLGRAALKLLVDK